MSCCAFRRFIFLYFLLIVLMGCNDVVGLVDTLSPQNCYHNHHFAQIREDVCGKLFAANISLLSMQQQKSIMLNIFTQQGVLISQLQDFTRLWNLKMPQGPKPDFVPVSNVVCRDDSSVACIENAWQIIGGVDDAYVAGEQVYAPASGMVHVQFDYKLNTPVDVGRSEQLYCGTPPVVNIVSSGANSHCGFRFSSENLTSNTLFGNGINGRRELDAHKRHLSYGMSEGIYTLNAQLDVVNKITVLVYDWKNTGTCHLPCGRSTCIYQQYRCDYSNSYSYIEQETLRESIQVVTPEPYGDHYELQFHDPDTAPLVTMISDLPDFIIRFGKTSLHKSKYKYNVFYRYPPYNYLWINQSSSPYVLRENTHLEVSNATTLQFTLSKDQVASCTLQILDPFLPYEVLCAATLPVSYTSFINASLDKSLYDFDDDVGVFVVVKSNNLPAQGEVEVEYAGTMNHYPLIDGETKFIQDHVAGEHEIIIHYGNYSSSLTFFSYDSRKYWGIFWLGFSILFLVLVYKSVVHVWERRFL